MSDVKSKVIKNIVQKVMKNVSHNGTYVPPTRKTTSEVDPKRKYMGLTWNKARNDYDYDYNLD